MAFTQLIRGTELSPYVDLAPGIEISRSVDDGALTDLGGGFFRFVEDTEVHGNLNYDEVVYVLEGEGVLHMHGREVPIRAGSCMHLPPLLMHCLENTGSGPMRVLGVFHPAGDPASRAAEANQ